MFDWAHEQAGPDWVAWAAWRDEAGAHVWVAAFAGW
jgi:hypothetical protein